MRNVVLRCFASVARNNLVAESVNLEVRVLSSLPSFCLVAIPLVIFSIADARALIEASNCKAAFSFALCFPEEPHLVFLRFVFRSSVIHSSIVCLSVRVSILHLFLFRKNLNFSSAYTPLIQLLPFPTNASSSQSPCAHEPKQRVRHRYQRTCGQKAWCHPSSRQKVPPNTDCGWNSAFLFSVCLPSNAYRYVVCSHGLYGLGVWYHAGFGNAVLPSVRASTSLEATSILRSLQRRHPHSPGGQYAAFLDQHPAVCVIFPPKTSLSSSSTPGTGQTHGVTSDNLGCVRVCVFEIAITAKSTSTTHGL